jgi:hypothetical protein
VIGMAGEHEENPFTPFGDGSLIRIANLHANILRIGQPERMAELFAMMSERSVRLRPPRRSIGRARGSCLRPEPLDRRPFLPVPE